LIAVACTRVDDDRYSRLEAEMAALRTELSTLSGQLGSAASADTECDSCRGAWALNASGHLLKTYEFQNFAAALEFANRLGAVAERQGHHPDLHVGWGRCGVELWTHSVGGLTASDFELAAKADRVFAETR
jgi:pterin-4a-carbinolamine dehydratase